VKVARTDSVTTVEIGFTNGVFSMHHNGNYIPVEMGKEVGQYKPWAIFESSIHEWENNFNACNHELLFKAPTVEQTMFILSSMQKIHINDTNMKKTSEVIFFIGNW
jgi:hypothetical protein